MSIKCCKGCTPPKRYPGCHSHCPEYIAEKALHDKQKADVDRQRNIEAGLTSQACIGFNRAHKAQRKMKGWWKG